MIENDQTKQKQQRIIKMKVKKWMEKQKKAYTEE